MTRTRRGKRRHGADNYPTPDWAVRRFLEEWPDLLHVGRRWLEPCAGDGVIIDVCNEFRKDIDWTAIEIRDCLPALLKTGTKRSQIHIGDFFRRFGIEPSNGNGKSDPGRIYTFPAAKDRPYDVAIFNPPFRLTQQFILGCLQIARVVICMQRMNYCGTAERNAFFRPNVPDLYVIPDRVSFTGDGNADACEHAWHVWGPHPRVGIAEWRVLKTTPKDERKRSRARVIQARSDIVSTLDELFAEATG